MAGTSLFISYSRTDTEYAKNLYKWLVTEVGISTFWDFQGLKVGHAWKDTIRASLDTSFAVIVLVSRASMNSQYVTYEWAYAQGQKKYIITLIIDPEFDLNKELHSFLDDIQYNKYFISPTDEDYEDLKDRLIELRDLSNVPDEVQQAVALARSPIPDNQLHAINLLEVYPDPSALRELKILAIDKNLRDRQINAALALAKRTDSQDSDIIDGLVYASAIGAYQKDGAARNHLSKLNSVEAADALYKSIAYAVSHKIKDIVETLLKMDTDNLPDIFVELLQRPSGIHNTLEMMKYLHMGKDERVIEIIISELEATGHPPRQLKLYEMLSQHVHPAIPEIMFNAIDEHGQKRYAGEGEIIRSAHEGLIHNVTQEVRDEVDRRSKSRDRRIMVQGTNYRRTLTEMDEILKKSN